MPDRLRIRTTFRDGTPLVSKLGADFAMDLRFRAWERFQKQLATMTVGESIDWEVKEHQTEETLLLTTTLIDRAELEEMVPEGNNA